MGYFQSVMGYFLTDYGLLSSTYGLLSSKNGLLWGLAACFLCLRYVTFQVGPMA